MKLTRERKIYFAIVTLAGLVFATDRLVLTAPADAALATEQVKSAGAGDSAALLAGLPTASKMVSLADRLRRLADAPPQGGEIGRDLFSAGETWMPSARALSEAQAERSDPSESFHLLAIILNGNRSCAIINGRNVAVGQQVGGMTLAGLTRTSAVLRSGQTQVVLHLAPQHASAR